MKADLYADELRGGCCDGGGGGGGGGGDSGADGGEGLYRNECSVSLRCLFVYSHLALLVNFSITSPNISAFCVIPSS
ncbi:unnamed protein product [Enterobius vermicularis]|uniref:Uncharacterized protein n=1 Tax=Enterobius vermicularis TaxID=51028 RepID=A0A0N4V8X9_ENTVE|nr:unnamed protein product [Enterobius vermicularis]